MKKIELIIGFSSYSDSSLEYRSNLIYTKMEVNPYIKQTTPPVGVVKDLAIEYSKALHASSSGDLNKISYKNEIRAKLITELQNLGRYINALYIGNKTVLLTTGYELTSENTDSYTLGAIENFKIVNGKTMGELISQCNGVKNKLTYMHQYTDEVPTENTNWTTINSTKSKQVISNLIPAKTYYFRMQVLGKGDQVNTTQSIPVVSQ